MLNNGFLFLNGKEIYKFKTGDKSFNFPTQFCLGSISNKFDGTEFREVSFKENVYDFSFNYKAINKSDKNKN